MPVRSKIGVKIFRKVPSTKGTEKRPLIVSKRVREGNANEEYQLIVKCGGDYFAVSSEGIRHSHGKVPLKCNEPSCAWKGFFKEGQRDDRVWSRANGIHRCNPFATDEDVLRQRRAKQRDDEKRRADIDKIKEEHAKMKIERKAFVEERKKKFDQIQERLWHHACVS